MGSKLKGEDTNDCGLFGEIGVRSAPGGSAFVGDHARPRQWQERSANQRGARGASRKSPRTGAGEADGCGRLERAYTLKLLPQPQEEVALGLLKTNPRCMSSSLKSMVTPSR